MLLAEDLTLLLYDDQSGRPVTDFVRLETALAGAVLLELSMRERVSVGDGRGAGKSGRLVVASAEPTGDPVLDQALAVVAKAEGKAPKQVFGRLKKGLRLRLLERLREQGIVHEVPGKGLFAAPWWPLTNTAHKDELRRRLSDVLVRGAEPDMHAGALISLLSAVGVVDKVLPADDGRALKRRAKQIADGAWAADAVGKVIRDMNAAIVGAITASAAVAIS